MLQGFGFMAEWALGAVLPGASTLLPETAGRELYNLADLIDPNDASEAVPVTRQAPDRSY